MHRLSIFLVLAALQTARGDDDRAADRAAIRAHIDSIYQAFIHQDLPALRATHAEDWRGFLNGSTQMIRGIEQYMQAVGSLKGPYGMTSYKLRDFDIIFSGDAAFATFISDGRIMTPAGEMHQVLRLGDFYVKKDGHWIQAGSNTSIHPDSIAEQMSTPRTLSGSFKQSLLDARESVWRAFFSNDRATLEKLLPEDTLTIDPGNAEFGTRSVVIGEAEQFAKGGGKLVRLEFPKTEIQSYGLTAIVYSTYVYEVERDGHRSQHSGRASETFVYRNGQWLNPGWHLDSEPRP
jgi:ketosteroid isomerase-like protein